MLRVLGSSGQVIIIADIAQNITVHITSNNPREATIPNYAIIPVVINVCNESGESINLFPASRYLRYLSTIQTWKFHFDVKATLSAPELQQTLGANGFVFNQTEIFMTNREGRILAAEYRLTRPLEALMALFSQPTHAAVPQNPQANVSTLTVLPCGVASKANDAIAEIIAELTDKTVDVPAPEWVSVIEIPGVSEFDNAISQQEAKIRNLSAEVEDLTQKKNHLLDFRKLLYSEGRTLEDIVRESLQYLGGGILPAKYSNEEYILVFNGHEYVVEVKGLTRSVSLTHFRQLMDYVLVAEESGSPGVKGILIANPWREIPPHERDTADKPEFPDNVVNRARDVQVALITTRELLHALTLCMSGKIDKRNVLEIVTGGNGRITFE